MEIRRLLGDDRAVSPIIGVILMVAVTVILSAVLAAFVLGFGQQNDSPPTVTFDYEVDSVSGGNDELVIQHISGDDFRSDRVEFSGSGIKSDDLGTSWTDLKGYSSDTTIRAGQSIRVEITDEDFELNVVWNADDGGDGSVLSTTSGPVPENPAP